MARDGQFARQIPSLDGPLSSFHEPCVSFWSGSDCKPPFTFSKAVDDTTSLSIRTTMEGERNPNNVGMHMDMEMIHRMTFC